MIEIKLRLNDGKGDESYTLTKEQAEQFRLKYQFQALLKGVKMVETDETETQFRLIKNGEIIGYFFMTPIADK